MMGSSWMDEQRTCQGGMVDGTSVEKLSASNTCASDALKNALQTLSRMVVCFGFRAAGRDSPHGSETSSNHFIVFSNFDASPLSQSMRMYVEFSFKHVNPQRLARPTLSGPSAPVNTT